MIGYAIGAVILICAYYWHKACRKNEGIFKAETIALAWIGASFVIGGFIYMSITV